MDLTTLTYSILGALAIFFFFKWQLRKVNENAEKWKRFWEDLAEHHGFNSSQVILSSDESMALGVDKNEGRICLVTRKPVAGNSFMPLIDIPKVLIIYYTDLLSAELFEDGNMITKTSRMSQAGGLIVGGLLLGTGGALLGGLTGKTVTESGKVKRLDLRIVINDIDRPTYDFNFLNFQIDKDGTSYNNKSNRARHWLGIMDVLIRRADIEARKPVASGDKNPAELVHIEGFSVANELEKLSSLKNRGILDKDEYEQQKLKVLARK